MRRAARREKERMRSLLGFEEGVMGLGMMGASERREEPPGSEGPIRPNSMCVY